MGNGSRAIDQHGPWMSSRQSQGLGAKECMAELSQARSQDSQLQVLREVIDRLARQNRELDLHRRYHSGRELEKDYVLTRTVLGVGINGGVRLAFGRDGSGRQFAVKTLDLQRHSKNKRWMKDLAGELEIMLTVDHPHIVRLIDIYETTAKLHFVMEYAEGGELFDRIVKRGSFSEDDAAEAARQMLSVVSYLHNQGIVHRDLKPENFMYESKGGTHLKLIDFGFSRHWDGTSPMTEQCGTLAYTAPEVFKGTYTSKSDLWSLGVIAFMLISGHAPFEGSRRSATRMKAEIALGKCKWRQEYWHNISSDGIDFVKSLMCLDPAERLNAQAAMRHKWIVARTQRPTLPGIHLSTANIHLAVLRGLRRFQGASDLRRSCLLTIAHSMTHCDIGIQARDYFLHVDAADTGVIDIKHLKEAICASGSSDDDEIQELLHALNETGVFSFSDVLASMVPSLIKPQEALLQETFRRFSLDPVPSGYNKKRISFQDFSELVCDTSTPAKEGATSTPAAPSLSKPPQKGQGTESRIKRWWTILTGHLKQQPSSIAAVAYQDHFLSMRTDLLHGYPTAPMGIMFDA